MGTRFSTRRSPGHSTLLVVVMILAIANPILAQTPVPAMRASDGAARVAGDVAPPKDATRTDARTETKVDPAEVLKVVNALEERVREIGTMNARTRI